MSGEFSHLSLVGFRISCFYALCIFHAFDIYGEG